MSLGIFYLFCLDASKNFHRKETDGPLSKGLDLHKEIGSFKKYKPLH